MDGCHIYGIVGRSVRTPVTSNGELRKEILQWIYLPIVNPTDRDYLLSTENTRLYIDKFNVSF